MASSALTNNKKLQLVYSDQGGTMNCGNIPTYEKALTPAYVMLVK